MDYYYDRVDEYADLSDEQFTIQCGWLLLEASKDSLFKPDVADIAAYLRAHGARVDTSSPGFVVKRADWLSVTFTEIEQLHSQELHAGTMRAKSTRVLVAQDDEDSIVVVE